VKRCSPFWPCFVVLCLPACVPGDQKPSGPPDPDIERLLGTDYYGVYLAGNKVGWAKMSMTRTDGQTPGYMGQLEFTARFTAAGSQREIQTVQTEEFEPTPPYAFRGGLFRQTDGKSGREAKVTRAAKGFDAVIRSGGEIERKQVASLDYTLADHTAVFPWMRKGPKPGETLTIRDIDLDKLNVGEATCKLIATRTAATDGVKVTYHELEVTHGTDGVTTLERYDAKEERLLSLKLGGLFELRLEPEKLAKNIDFSRDFFELGKVRVDRRLGERSRISGLVLETSGRDELNLKPGPFQAVARNGSGTHMLKLGWDYGVVAKATPDEIQNSLAETPVYPINHPKIQALAAQAVGDAQTPKEKVKRLVHFVARYIEPSYSTRPLTVLDVVQTRKGACTEYAKLYTTLARAAGVPTREVAGLVYMGDDERAFGLHAWNEVVLNGQWLPVDATADETEPDPTHICFGSTVDEQGTNVVAALTKLSFRVVDVKYQK
jgi:Transglutaminase-like superfamily